MDCALFVDCCICRHSSVGIGIKELGGSAGAVLGKNIWGAWPPSLNFPSFPLFPTPFPTQTDRDLDNCDFTSFSETFTSIFHNCFPLEKYSLRKNTTPRNRWMTNLVWLDPVPKEKKCIKLISRTHLMLILGNINHIGIS